MFTKEDSSNLQNLQHNLPSQPKFQFNDLSVSYSEVLTELSNLNVHKACGPDQICPHLLKEGAKQLFSSLVKIFNKSLREGVLPLDWVSANITPIHKKGDKHLVVNYRLISLTCILCKVLEKLVHRKLYTLLDPMMYYLMFSLGFVQSDLLFLCCYQLFITGQKLWIAALVFTVFSLILPSLWLSPTCKAFGKTWGTWY